MRPKRSWGIWSAKLTNFQGRRWSASCTGPTPEVKLCWQVICSVKVTNSQAKVAIKCLLFGNPNLVRSTKVVMEHLLLFLLKIQRPQTLLLNVPSGHRDVMPKKLKQESSANLPLALKTISCACEIAWVAAFLVEWSEPTESDQRQKEAAKFHEK